MTVAVTLDQVMAVWGKSRMPKIKPELSRERYSKTYSKWRLQLVEVWPDDMHFGASDLDERVEWTYQTLKTWESARRTAWDMWVFDSKKEADKFITLYHLTWA